MIHRLWNNIGWIFSIIVCLPLWAVELAWGEGDAAAPNIAVVNFGSAELSISSSLASKAPTTVTLGPLMAKRTDQAWLSKAISDLIIKNLSEVRSLIVLEREKTQTFLNELELNKSGLIDETKALRLGRVAKVEQVIYGNYDLKNNQITIQLFLMDLNTQNITQTAQISGSLDRLRGLIKELVLDFLNKQKTILSAEELKDIQFEVTDSITATKHFYQGIDLYDQGKYADALAQFMIATQQDGRYREASLWLGKMFESLKYYSHAIEIYQSLYQRYPQSVEAKDALFFAAELEAGRLDHPQEAIAYFKTLMALTPATPHSVEAAFHLGQLYSDERQWLEAYQSFKVVDDFRQQFMKDRLTVIRHTGMASRFKSWPHALELYHDAIAEMILTYQKIVDESPREAWPRPPRGVLLIEPETAEFNEQKIGSTPSLFPLEYYYPDWHEDFYVVIIPKQYAAAGIDLKITGQLKDQDPGYSYDLAVIPYPFPLDFDRFRLGSIFGQTSQLASLNKYVSFHGKNPSIFALHILQNHAVASQWGIHVRFSSSQTKASKPLTVEVDRNFWEGQKLASIILARQGITGSTRTLQKIYYQPKKEIDVLFSPVLGYLSVAAQGDLDGHQTDLWFTHSSDGKQWSPLVLPEFNSLSEDYNPRLLNGEKGDVRLAWISNRRGIGWELWLNSLDRDFKWDNAHRVPLEKLVDPGTKNFYADPSVLLEYDIVQDQQGRWIIAYYSYAQHSIVLIASSDSTDWQILTTIPVNQITYGLALTQDSSGVYRLGYFGTNGTIFLYSSNDLKEWRHRDFRIDFWKQSWAPSPRSHRMRLFALPVGELLMLVSDSEYGLQYARFNADMGEPVLDLVSRAGLEAYGITRIPDDKYLVAFKDKNEIIFREYKNFNSSGEAIKKDTRNWPIYMTTETNEGQTWRHIFAQSRRRISDVTALGADANGRVWWGIESGIMYKENESYFATDVSQGFFNDLVTQIQTCGENTLWLSSNELSRPLLGFVGNTKAATEPSGKPASVQFGTRQLDDAHGRITALGCSDEQILLVGTSNGEIIGFDGRTTIFKNALGEGLRITALYYDQPTGLLWIGTEGQGVYQMDINNKVRKPVIVPLTEQLNVYDIVSDHQGSIWIAAEDQGLRRFKGRQWQSFTPENSQVPYWSIGKLAADSTKGVWLIAHADSESQGLGYFDGKTGRVENPPHDLIKAPSSLMVDRDGRVWVGTWFDGIYQFNVQQGKK